MASNAEFCCSQCSFVAKFESALSMHKQLYHEMPSHEESIHSDKVKSYVARPHSAHAKSIDILDCKPSRSPNYSPSTKFFNRLCTKFSRSKFFGHNDNDSQQGNEPALVLNNETKPNLKKLEETIVSKKKDDHHSGVPKQHHYGCHLCSFIADRITALDRHLLNDHQLGLDNLLKLVMAKTKDSLADEDRDLANIKTPYYKQPNEIINEGDLVIENVTPKIRILKHAAVNTDLKHTDIPLLDENCRLLKNELETIIQKAESPEDELISKMKVLNDYMCRFVNSSNNLKKVLNKEYSKSRQNLKEKGLDESQYEFSLGDLTPRKWEQSQSEKYVRSHRSNNYEDKDYDRNNSIF